MWRKQIVDEVRINDGARVCQDNYGECVSVLHTGDAPEEDQ
jgi:hypothetical protein